MYNEVIEDFNFNIEKVKSEGKINLKKAIEGIQLCNSTLTQLNRLIDKNGFASEAVEIHYFKNIKVQPLSSLVYFNEIRNCQISMPKMGVKDQLSYLNKQVRKINKFFVRNPDFVQYMEQELNHLDTEYFTRKKQGFPFYAIPEACFYDPNYYTSHDMLWARIKGFNEFTEYLKRLILTIEFNRREDIGFRKVVQPLVWTESKTALAELIYALYSSAAINNGKEGIKGISIAFEEIFNVKLDNIYKTYSEIKMRKGSKAKFLEELTVSLNHKISNDDAL